MEKVNKAKIEAILSIYTETLEQLLKEGNKKAFFKSVEYIGERLWNEFYPDTTEKQ